MNIIPYDAIERVQRPLDIALFQEGPPQIAKPLRDTYVETHGQRLSRLDCFILGIPRPSVEWRFANQPIRPEDRRYRITADRPPGVHTLTIVQPNDAVAGRYEVLAENPHGRASCSATVHLPLRRSSSITTRTHSVYATLPRHSMSHSLPRQRPVSPWQQLSPAASVQLTPSYTTTRRFMREISEPPNRLQRHTSSTHLRIQERHQTPPVQFTFQLPRTTSRTEVSRHF